MNENDWYVDDYGIMLSSRENIFIPFFQNRVEVCPDLRLGVESISIQPILATIANLRSIRQNRYLH
jgi:hypothetical protein